MCIRPPTIYYTSLLIDNFTILFLLCLFVKLQHSQAPAHRRGYKSLGPTCTPNVQQQLSVLHHRCLDKKGNETILQLITTTLKIQRSNPRGQSHLGDFESALEFLTWS